MKRALSILLAALLLLVALPTVAEEGGLRTGLYVSDAGTEMMYLYKEGVGVLISPTDNQIYCSGVFWTNGFLEIERSEVPFAVTEDVLSFTYGGTALALRYKGESDAFVLGDQAGSAFAGEYASEDGKQLSLSADGQGLYLDDAGYHPVFWGSFLSYFNSDELTAANCYILFGSFLGGMDFVDGMVQLDTETEEKVTLSLVTAPETPETAEESAMTLISSVFDLSLKLPVGGWTVEETEAGLVVFADSIQYTFLSVPLEKAPDAAMMDTYADHIWTDGLMGAGVAYDAADTIKTDYAVGEASGRAAATEWTRDDVLLKGDSVLWYTNGRLYVALCVAPEDVRPIAMGMLDAALQTFRTAEEAEQALTNQLPLDKAVLEELRELAPEEVAADQVYYGYRMTSDGQAIDLIPFLSGLGLDPNSFCLTLRPDGTGSMQMMDEGGELTWTEDTLTANEETIPYTREGDHIVIAIGDESIEFAPAAEVEALIAEMAAGSQKGEPVVPVAEELVGSWTLTKARAMGVEIPASMMGTEMSLVLSEEGTAILMADGSPTELEWAIREDGKVDLTAAGTEIFSLVYDGTVLVLVTESDSVEMVFEKDA